MTLAVTPEQIITYARLLARRTRASGRDFRYAYAIGQAVAVYSHELPGGVRLAFAYVVLETGLMFTMPHHDAPDPQLRGSLLGELAAAHMTGELQAMRDELAAEIAAAGQVAPTPDDPAAN